MAAARVLPLLLLLGWPPSLTAAERGAPRYLGRAVGRLSELQHGVKGSVYAVDSRTLYIHDFHYDGQGPAAYFYVGTSGSPGEGGVRLRDERGAAGPLRPYRGDGLTLPLPDGLTLKDIRWLSVWCDDFSVNFGSVSVPGELEYPRPARLGALRGVHGVRSDPIVVVDAQTLLVPNFSYDGEAPDAKFWVGRGDTPSPAGIRIPDENGKEAPLRKYSGKTIVLTLPGELTVFDIGHFAVWCEAFTVNFGHVTLPRSLTANVPPSLKMLGVSPQSKLNCEVLEDELAFEVRWAVAGDSVVLQLVAKLEDGEYMSFGVSGDSAHSQMVGADVVVAWVDKATLQGHAVDYYLDAKSQCAGVRGSCPDERLSEKTNSVRLLNAALVNGYSIVTYQRSLGAADELDRPLRTNGSQPVVWAVGPLNSRQEVSYHHHYTKGDKFIEFGRPPVWNCPMPETDEPQTAHTSTNNHTALTYEHDNTVRITPNPVPTPAPAPPAEPWEIPPIQCYEPPDGVFYAQMGPTGGKQGYSAITGHVGWGLSWYINGLLIPEVNVVRGRRYTFVVEGGRDPRTPATYHPFYITNDPVGGYYHKTDEEKKGVEIYAGVRRLRSGELVPTGVGRLCSWTADARGPPPEEYPSFGAYQRSLTLVCDEGNPGVLTWTPDTNTPDTVYYQCFTHRHLGWKINVLDECTEEPDSESDSEPAPAESKLTAAVAAPPPHLGSQVQTRAGSESNSIRDRVGTEKIMNTKTNYDDFSSDRQSPTPSPDRTRPPVSAGEIRDMINAVEDLEAALHDSARRNHTQQQQQQKHQQQQQHQLQFQQQHHHPYDRPVYSPSNQYPHTVVLPGDPAFTNSFKKQYQIVPRPTQEYELHQFLNLPLTRPQTSGGRYPGGEGEGPRWGAPPGAAPPAPPGAPPAPPGARPLTLQSVLRPRRPGPVRRAPGPPTSLTLYPQSYSHPKKPYGKLPLPPHRNQPPRSVPPTKSVTPTRPGKLPPKKTSPSMVGPVVIGQPIAVHSTSEPIANHRSNGLPGGNDVAAQQSAPQPQIVLGKPMDYPVPLDRLPQPPPSPPSPPPVHLPDSDVKSSDFIGESAETSTIPPAVNTGFKPNTIVIESGFKPIIREPLMDRSSDYEDGGVNRRQDTDVDEDYAQAPQQIDRHEPPSSQLTESFQPMFIPSPPDNLLSGAEPEPPRPVYLFEDSRPNALFGEQNLNKTVPDLVMEADRVSPQYLPPDPKEKTHSQKLLDREQTFTTYDGKTVSAVTLTGVPDLPTDKKFSAKIPPSSVKLTPSKDLLLKTPQFGPFKGEIPPPADEVVSKIKENATDKDKETHLKLLNTFLLPQESDTIKAESSHRHEVTAEKSDEKDNEKDKEKESLDSLEELFEFETLFDSSERQKREITNAIDESKDEVGATQFERGESQVQQHPRSNSTDMTNVDFTSAASSVNRPAVHRTLTILLLTGSLKFL